jgi:hypothetical protein
VTKNKEGKFYEDRPCILCKRLGLADDSPSLFHHIREGRLGKRGTKGIPLCEAHHVGKFGIHGLGKKAFEAKYGISEEQLLALSAEKE